MTEWRAELIKDVTNAMFKVENMQCSTLLVMARAALAVAEPVIREECAKIADATAKDYRVYRDHWSHAEGAEQVATAIRDGGKSE